MDETLQESFLGNTQAEEWERPQYDSLRESFARMRENWKSQKSNPWLPWQASAKRMQDDRATWRKELGEALDSTPAHVIIVVLLLVDLIATGVDILKMVHNKTNDLQTCVDFLEKCYCAEQFEKSESWEFLYWISIAILTILALNVLGLLVAFGTSFFCHAGYVLDAFVVFIALVLEIFLDTDTVSLVIVLTLWRIVRVCHGIFEVTDEAWEQEVEKFDERLEEAESRHLRDQELLRQKDERIAQLQGRQDNTYIDRY